jgi:hypothetical protein
MTSPTFKVLARFEHQYHEVTKTVHVQQSSPGHYTTILDIDSGCFCSRFRIGPDSQLLNEDSASDSRRPPPRCRRPCSLILDNWPQHSDSAPKALSNPATRGQASATSPRTSPESAHLHEPTTPNLQETSSSIYYFRRLEEESLESSGPKLRHLRRPLLKLTTAQRYGVKLHR